MASYTIFDQRWLKSGVAKELRRRAMLGVLSYNQRSPFDRKYINQCTALHQPTGTRILFTRDTGHHTSGWWKNPQYESCFHLSLSFEEDGEPCPRNKTCTKDWLEVFFGDNRRLIWTEPPYSKDGKQSDVWHYRLFVHPDWKTPILPQKEVYTKDFTEAGWKSWSDVQAELEESQQQLIERLMNA